MFYLIVQIALTLFFTALIGITMGWLLRGLGTSRQIETIDARWRAHVAQLKERGNYSSITTEPTAELDSAADETIAELQKQIGQRDELLETLRTAKNLHSQRNSDAEGLAMQLKDSTERCDQLQGHLGQQKNTIDQFRAKLETLTGEKEMLIERLRDRETEIGRMSQERQHAINTIASLQKEMRTIRGQRSLDAANSRHREAASTDRTTAAPQSTGSAAGRSVVADAAAPGPQRQSLPATQRPQTTTEPVAPAQPDRPVAVQPDLRPQPASGQAAASPEPARQQQLPIADNGPAASTPRYEPAWRLSAPQGPRDNLQAIFGIGPKLEKQLNRLGIFHFGQIGQFDSNDILWVARHLKSFPGRIVRDRWIEQAKSLEIQKRN